MHYLIFLGYYVIISPLKLLRYGGKVNAGEKLGTAVNFECNIQYPPPNYIRVQLFKQGLSIDPTHHLTDCNIYFIYFKFF